VRVRIHRNGLDHLLGGGVDDSDTFIVLITHIGKAPINGEGNASWSMSHPVMPTSRSTRDQVSMLAKGLCLCNMFLSRLSHLSHHELTVDLTFLDRVLILRRGCRHFLRDVVVELINSDHVVAIEIGLATQPLE
jgi:hypothetical protein